MAKEVTEKVKAIISEQLGVDEAEVTTGASFVDDLGADSLDRVELVMALEEAFDLTISDEETETWSAVGAGEARFHQAQSSSSLISLRGRRDPRRSKNPAPTLPASWKSAAGPSLDNSSAMKRRRGKSASLI